MQVIGRVAAAAILGLGAVHAQTKYKTIGPGGNTVYRDHPPVEGKVEKTLHFVEWPSSPVRAYRYKAVCRCCLQEVGIFAVSLQMPTTRFLAGAGAFLSPAK